MSSNNWVAAGAALVAMAASVASADVVGGLVTGGSSGGSFQLIAPPAAIGPDSLESPDLFAFDEEQDVVLTQPLPIGLGRVAGVGSVLSSHYVAFDPAEPSTLEAAVDFDAAIVGLIRGDGLDGTTALFGIDSTTYTTAPALGVDMTDEVLIAPGMPNRLILRYGANSPGDHLRVLTGTIVPEPTTVLLVSIAAIGLCTRRNAA
ncbi:MAG: PEP-CTERM sorting domain-containing protein [Planctomycetota bacterium]